MPAELTVIIPAVNTLLDLTGCLEALDAQRKDVQLEAIVVNRLGDTVSQAMPRLFPGVRVLEVSQETTIPQMRAMGISAASGKAVAIIEDHVQVPKGWARQMLDALGDGNRIVGGAVENTATGTLMDWSAFLCEYSHLIPPIQGGPVSWLTGNNTVYPRAILEAHADIVNAGQWENYLHDRLREAGVELYCASEIVVGHKKHYTFSEYMSQRYLYARSYAGARVAGQGLAKRVAYGLASFALPPLLLYRTVTRIARKRRHLGILVRSIPLISAFVVSGSAGEVVGSFFGPGDSLAKVC
jgi:glycosyltransferase involved in cell wall biosynthesis